MTHGYAHPDENIQETFAGLDEGKRYPSPFKATVTTWSYDRTPGDFELYRRGSDADVECGLVGLGPGPWGEMTVSFNGHPGGELLYATAVEIGPDGLDVQFILDGKPKGSPISIPAHAFEYPFTSPAGHKVNGFRCKANQTPSFRHVTLFVHDDAAARRKHTK